MTLNKESSTQHHHDNSRLTMTLNEDSSAQHHHGNKVHPGLPITPRTKTRRRNLWKRLRKRLRRHGTVEIDKDHRRFKTLEHIRMGIRELIIDHKDTLGPKVRFIHCI